METFFYADLYTKNILSETFDLKSVSEMKKSKIVVLSCGSALSPKYLKADPTKYTRLYDLEEDDALRLLYYRAKLLGLPVLAFGKPAALIHAFNGGRIYHQVNNHMGRKHELFKWNNSEFMGVKEGEVFSSHYHSIDVLLSNELREKFKLHLASFSSTTKIRYLPGCKHIEDRTFAPYRAKSFWNCDPEVYSWNLGKSTALCFEFFPTDENIELIAGQIGTNSNIDWPERK